MSYCVQEGVVVVNRAESESVMLCSGRCGDMGHKLQSVMLCPGECDDSGQGRVTKCHVVFRKAK